MPIRKISIGPDYKNAMHYSVDQTVCGDHVITNIRQEHGDHAIYIQKSGSDEIVKWKSYSDTVPKSIEYNINFE
jgi:hypothetical protein